MIKVNGEVVNIEHFPDGTQRLKCFPKLHKMSDIPFEWIYESDEELVTLMFVVNHLRDKGFSGNFILCLNYVSNGRMDRTHYEEEIFTLKWFCKIINDLKFSKIIILDPHSNVTPALLNNVVVDNGFDYILKAINKIEENSSLILYFPDYSAMKKYTAILPKHFKYVYGNKVRDWDSGKILGIEIVNDFKVDLTNKNILMIDDIIAYGGSMHFGALKLKESGVNKIYAYATHTENSILDKEKGTLIKDLENNTVERLFTTNSLFRGEHEKITVMEV